jgi:hypothetical protein
MSSGADSRPVHSSKLHKFWCRKTSGSLIRPLSRGRCKGSGSAEAEMGPPNMTLKLLPALFLSLLFPFSLSPLSPSRLNSSLPSRSRSSLLLFLFSSILILSFPVHYLSSLQRSTLTLALVFGFHSSPLNRMGRKRTAGDYHRTAAKNGLVLGAYEQEDRGEQTKDEDDKRYKQNRQEALN